MRFFSKARPLPAPPTDARTEALSSNSSDALSILLNQMDRDATDLISLPTPGRSVFLDEEVLLRQGKMHKTKVLSKWIACQAYLSQAEVDVRARQEAFRIAVSSDGSTATSDMFSRSGLTSRSSTSTTATTTGSPAQVSGQSNGFKRRHLPFLGRRGTARPSESEFLSVNYATFTDYMTLVDLDHDDSARMHEEWSKLESEWKRSLHLAGPKTNIKRAKATAT